MSGATCDVCGGPSVCVLCSALGAYSLAYCDTCARSGAEPYGMVVATVALEGARILDVFHDDVLESLFASVLRAGKTAAEFWADVAAETERQKADFARVSPWAPRG